MLPAVFHSLKAWPEGLLESEAILNPFNEAMSASAGSACRRKNLTPEPSGFGLSIRSGSTSMSTAAALEKKKKASTMAHRAKERHEAEVVPTCFVMAMVEEKRSDRLVKLVLVGCVVVVVVGTRVS